MKLFLVGFMGSGKSTVGKKLAKKTGFDFIDLDRFIEKESGLSISDIFEKYGEEKFREFEHENLKKIMELPQDIIVSTGGGTPCFHDNMKLIKLNGKSVYLQLDVKAILNRLRGSKTVRPLFSNIDDDKQEDYIKNELAKREKYYLNSHQLILFPNHQA